LDISFIYQFTVIRVFWSLQSLGDKRSGDSTMVDVQIFLEAFLNMPLRSAYFTAVLSGKKQNFCLEIIFLKCQIIRISNYKTSD
jgi:hypothetical protein